MLTAADMEWLKANESERMDATVDGVFDSIRQAFHRARYEFAARFAPGKRVADVACGTGYGSAIMADAGAASVVGVDIDAPTIMYAREHYGAGALYRVAQADCTGLASGSVDLVASFETLEHVGSDIACIGEFARILSPGGTLIASVPNQWIGQFPHHLRVYDRMRIVKLLLPAFDIEAIWNHNSGSGWKFNRQQPAGMVLNDDDNAALAECLIVVGRKR